MYRYVKDSKPWQIITKIRKTVFFKFPRGKKTWDGQNDFSQNHGVSVTHAPSFRCVHHRESTLEWPTAVHSRLCGCSYLIKFLKRKVQMPRKYLSFIQSIMHFAGVHFHWGVSDCFKLLYSVTARLVLLYLFVKICVICAGLGIRSSVFRANCPFIAKKWADEGFAQKNEPFDQKNVRFTHSLIYWWATWAICSHR